MPSNASRLRTRTLPASIDSIATRWSPIGFGRSGERVLKTPCSALDSIPPWVHSQHVATGPIEPGEEQDLLAGLDAVEAFDDSGIEDEPGVGGAFVALIRS